MLTLVLPVIGTKKALWSVTSIGVLGIVMTPELTVALGALLAIIFTGIVNVIVALRKSSEVNDLKSENSHLKEMLAERKATGELAHAEATKASARPALDVKVKE